MSTISDKVRRIAHRPGPGRLGHLQCRDCGTRHDLGPLAVSLPEWIHTLERFAVEHACEAQKGQTT